MEWKGKLVGAPAPAQAGLAGDAVAGTGLSRYIARPMQTTQPQRLRPLRVPSRTRTLDNGLRVVVHEDRSVPLVAVHLMFHAGSRHERSGRTGLAHLLEHLMFEGTAEVPKGGFDDLLERVGASNNGSTWWDRTNYYETVPSNAVEVALWLERDRALGFHEAVDDVMLELQRGVVINERREAYENRPYGTAEERLQAMVFPEGHPYRWPTIGYEADLRRITLEDVHDFHDRAYAPGNAVLVLAGDLAEEEAFRLAERYFGDLPKRAPLDAPPPPAAATGASAETVPDRVSFPRLYRAWAVPAYGTPEWAALDVLAYLLADGESSRLNEALVRRHEMAQEVDCWLYPTELAGMLGIQATARTGVPAADLHEVVSEILHEVATRGPDPEEVEGAIRRARRDQVLSIGGVESRAEALAYAATVLGSAEALHDSLDAYLDVTPERVAESASRLLPPDGGATLVFVPEEGGP
jgi:zinc protease